MRKDSTDVGARLCAPTTTDKLNLPELPRGWVWTRLDTISELIRGVSYDKEECANQSKKGYVPILRATNIDKELNFDDLVYVPLARVKDIQFVKAEDILIAMSSGSKDLVGKAAQARQDFQGAFGTFCGLVRVFTGLDKRLIGFFFQSPTYRNRISSLSSGININNLRREHVESMPLPLPPLPEQQRIVAKIEELFTELDAGVEALQKIKAQLKRYRQAVLKHAFDGKLTEAWREAHKGELEPASVLLERIRAERAKNANVGASFHGRTPRARVPRPYTVDTSSLPQLPEGWVWTTVGEIADDIHYGYTESAVEEPIGPKFLRITDIQNNSVNWSLVPYCKIDESEKSKYLLKDGDLVFARTGATVGKSFLIVGNPPEAVFASYLIRIVLNPRVDNKFVYSFFQSTDYWLQIVEGKLGIGQPNVNAQILSRIVFPLPSIFEQHQIVEEIERRFSIADEVEKVVEQSLKQAERLRQSILKRAFEGKLVSQDPNDEPADKLLERIKQAKSKM